MNSLQDFQSICKVVHDKFVEYILSIIKFEEDIAYNNKEINNAEIVIYIVGNDKFFVK